MIDGQPDRPRSRRLFWISVVSLVVGIAPLAANYASDAVARALGCYISEYGIYERSGTWGDFSDDVVGCRVAGTDIGSLLVDAHTAGLAIVLTWPLILFAILLWASFFVRRFRPSRIRHTDAPD